MFSVPLALSSVLGNVVAGVGESVLQKRGVPLLRIRKAMSWAANAMQGGAVLLFGLSPSPSLALVGYFFLRLGMNDPLTTTAADPLSCKFACSSRIW
jgi:hypothetical protein